MKRQENKTVAYEEDDLLPHYDFDYSKAKPNRFAERMKEDSLVVVLDPDVAAVFKTSEAVNAALRALIATFENLSETESLEGQSRS